MQGKRLEPHLNRCKGVGKVAASCLGALEEGGGVVGGAERAIEEGLSRWNAGRGCPTAPCAVHVPRVPMRPARPAPHGLHRSFWKL